MAISTLIQESTMEDSYIFSVFNTNKELTTKMLTYIKTAVKIEDSMIEEQLLQIKKSRISPLLDIVMGAYNRGEIELLYNKNASVPTAVPFIIRRDPAFRGNARGVKATIFISNFGVIDKRGQLNIPMKNLYILLESAYIGLFIHTHPATIQKSIGLMKILTETYTEMLTRLFNREYALMNDIPLYSKVTFCISRFFLEKVWESTNSEVIFNASMVNIKNPDVPDLRILNEQFNEAEIKDISDLLIFIKELSPRLDNLSVNYFMQRYIMTYHGSAVMAIDYLPYMFFVMINTIIGGFLMNQTVMLDIIKNQKDIRNFYAELGKILL